MERETLQIPAMNCAHCVRTIETELRALDGVAEVRVDLAAKRVDLAWTAPADRAGIVALLEEIGFPPVPQP
jgi:copper chaperone CopZ